MLEVTNVRRAFGSVQAVDGVSFSINRGATFGLLGPNGAGKTTTMRMLLGILQPDSGTVTWNGKSIDNATRRRFGYLPEERGLYGKMKVRDQIVYFGRLHGMTDPEVGQRADAWLQSLEIDEYAQRPTSELSKGNQQKVQVACAAVHDPELLILDEPFSGLDPINADILLANLRALQARGTTLVLSSHQLWQIESLCTEFCIIAKGGNRANGTLTELRRGWPTRVVRVEPKSAALQAVLAATDGAHERATANSSLLFDVPADLALPELLRRLVGAADVTAFERMEPSLQDIYLRAIGESA